MKKIFIAAVMAIAVSTSAFADASKVSSTIRSNFSADFAGASEVEWKTTSDFTKASFVLDGAKVEAFYNAQGQLFATGTSIDMSALSKKTLQTIAKKYAGYVIKEAVTVTNDEQVATKYIALEKANLRLIVEVDSDGGLSLFSRTKK